MKYILRLLGLALLAVAPILPAQQYGYVTVTNNTGLAIAWNTGDQTNWAAAVTANKYDSFVLEVKVGSASAVAGPLNLRWSVSSDGTAYTSTTPGASAQAVGWFSCVTSNGAAGVATWSTNITMNSHGYWRIDNATNQTGVTLTNFQIRAYFKPKRQG